MKNEILQKSLRYFLKHGIRKMSNDKLVEQLGISTKTLYKYFKNKEELLEEALDFYYTQQYEELKKKPADKSAACLLFDIWYEAIVAGYKINNVFYKDLHYYYPELGRKSEAAVVKKFSEQFLLTITRGMAEDSFRKDIIPEVVLENIFVQYEAIARLDRFKRFRLSPTSILLNTIAHFIRGFCTQKGSKELDDHIQTHLLSVDGKKSLKDALTDV